MWRWWRVREKRDWEERRRERRRWWWRVVERMEFVRSVRWDGVRVESAAMMVAVVSSIVCGIMCVLSSTSASFLEPV